MRITGITRRDIAGAVTIEKIDWSSRLEDDDFLARLFDLDALPSNDSRFPNAAGDIWQHRVNNPSDWDDDWVFHDGRFDLMGCEDELYLRFLCETIHPAVRIDASEAERICELYNGYLKQDGFELVEKTRISGRPVFAGREIAVVGAPGIKAARQVLGSANATHVAQQITRMEASVENDPDLAIGTAKELVETCCKSILQDRAVEIPKRANLTKLVKLASAELKLTPADIPDSARAIETIKRLLSNLATITQGIAELRNAYGTGHGKVGTTKGLTARHARLAVGAASTLAVFLAETHQERN